MTKLRCKITSKQRTRPTQTSGKLDGKKLEECKIRVCCDKSPRFKVTYNGGDAGNDIIFVCDNHITKHPFNKEMILMEVIEN